MDDLRFYLLFNSISVIYWEGDYEKPYSMKPFAVVQRVSNLGPLGLLSRE